MTHTSNEQVILEHSINFHTLKVSCNKFYVTTKIVKTHLKYV